VRKIKISLRARAQHNIFPWKIKILLVRPTVDCKINLPRPGGNFGIFGQSKTFGVSHKNAGILSERLEAGETRGKHKSSRLPVS
jgi:hypothetical protein